MNNFYHIVVISEAWMKKSESHFYEIEGYNLYVSERVNRDGGGVVIYVHRCICSSLQFEFSDNFNNFLIVYLRKLKLKIIGVYNTNNELFFESFDQVLSDNSNAIILGDININLLKENAQTKKLYELLIINGYQVLNKINKKYSTRNSADTRTIIDHAYSDLNDFKFDFILATHHFTDHESMTLQIKHPSIKIQKDVLLNKNIFNLRIFLLEYQSTRTNSELTFKEYHENICKYVQKNTHTKQSKITYKNNLPYLNNYIKKSIVKRNKLYKLMKKYPNNLIIKNVFIKTRNLVTMKIRQAKQNYESNRVMDCNGDSKKLWKVINSYIYNKNSLKNDIDNLLVNNCVISDKTELCNILNETFISTANLAELNNVFDYSFIPFMQLLPNYFAFYLVSSDEVLKNIYSLKENTAPGYDGITVQTIKSILTDDLLKLTSYINYILLNASFPSELKIAKVLPIYKQGNKALAENYRPIAILPTFAKAIEKIMCDQLTNYLNETNFFSSNQFGFIRKSGTSIACVNLIQQIQSSVDSKKVTACTFIDLKKAFDTVKHELLIEHLNKINMAYDAKKLIKSFLQNRKQYVQIGNDRSTIKNVECGVPQGSRLAAPLFIIYLNDIFELNLFGFIQLYADDIALTYSCSNLDELQSKMQTDLNTISEYMSRKLLVINTKKTNYIIFRQKNDKLNNFHLFLSNDKINRQMEVKYLGLTITAKLTWNKHIDDMKKKIIPYIAVIRKAKYALPLSCLRHIYNAYIQSGLCYLIQIWGTAPKYKINEIQRIQNKAIKNALRYHRLTETELLFRDNKFLKIENMIKLGQITFIYKIKNDIIRNNLQLITNIERHGHNTRSANLMNTYASRTFRNGINSVLNCAMLAFNNVPQNIKNSTTYRSFHNLTKIHLQTFNSSTLVTN